MIPNCRGCEEEMYQAFIFQELGYDVGLEGMGKREHCTFWVLDKKGNWVVEYHGAENSSKTNEVGR